MADLDDFFAKKDKKKKGTKKFSKANTEVIAKNLEESAIKEQLQQDKDITTNIGDEMNQENVNQQVGSVARQVVRPPQYFQIELLLTLGSYCSSPGFLASSNWILRMKL